jgi:hypothetical protein
MPAPVTNRRITLNLFTGTAGVPARSFAPISLARDKAGGDARSWNLRGPIVLGTAGGDARGPSEELESSGFRWGKLLQ